MLHLNACAAYENRSMETNKDTKLYLTSAPKCLFPLSIGMERKLNLLLSNYGWAKTEKEKERTSDAIVEKDA